MIDPKVKTTELDGATVSVRASSTYWGEKPGLRIQHGERYLSLGIEFSNMTRMPSERETNKMAAILWAIAHDHFKPDPEDTQMHPEIMRALQEFISSSLFKSRLRLRPLMVWQRFYAGWLTEWLQELGQKMHDYAVVLGANCDHDDCGDYTY